MDIPAIDQSKKRLKALKELNIINEEYVEKLINDYDQFKSMVINVRVYHDTLSLTLNLEFDSPIIIHWGDVMNLKVKDSKGLKHTYKKSGDYKIYINGNVTSFGGCGDSLISVESYGDLPLKKLNFMNSSFLESIPDYIPETVTDLSHMFDGIENFHLFEDLRNLDFNTLNVDDMSYMFANTGFNIPFLDFDTSNVKKMVGMFQNARGMRKIIRLNTQNVEDMSYMFADNEDFSSNLVFDTRNVKKMVGMFENTSFNILDLHLNFDTQNVEDMSYMFRNTQYFDGVLKFKINEDTNLTGMFETPYGFDMSNWHPYY